MSTSDLKEKPKQTARIVAGALAALLAVTIFIFSCIPGSDLLPGHPDILNIITHFCLYLVLAVLLTLAFNSPKRALWLTALFAVLIASAYGVTDELHQLLTPGRFSDPMDWIVDTAGALVGAIATIWFLSSRKVKRSRQRDSKL